MTGNLVGWADLQDAAMQRHSTTTGSSREQWRLVLHLIDGRMSGRASESVPPLTGRQWHLVSVRVEGFRGIGPVLEVGVDPTAGLTVVHAPNGTGKSSLADAVRAAMWGSPSAQSRALWRPVDRASGASRAAIELRLRSGSEELVMRWSDDEEDGGPVLRSAEGERVVSVADPKWQSALLAFAPVFSYAEVHDSIGTDKALQEHLENLLALGPCFMLLKGDVEQQAAEAKKAGDRLHKLKYDAQAAVAAIDERFGHDNGRGPAQIVWPHLWTRDVDEWLQEHGLDGDATALSFEPPTDLIGRISRQADLTRAALARMAELEDQLAVDPRVQAPLVDLHIGLREAPPEGPCPVCGSEDVGWFANLSAIAARLKDWQDQRTELSAQLHDLLRMVSDDLRPLVAAASALHIADAFVASLGAAADRLDAERARPHGESSATQRVAAGELVDLLRSEELAELVREVEARCEHAQQWVDERKRAVAELVAEWRVTGSLAAEASNWAQAAKKVTSLRTELRGERGETLSSEVNGVISRLLPESELQLSGLSFKSSASAEALQLKDSAGEPVRLGMLSAGQRNALLLAPLLRLPADGPFRFLIIDDPVHAFDDARVDLLSDELLRLAKHRRVIVLTHDAVLQEALAAKRPDAQLLTMNRVAATGQVTVVERSQPWQSLLDEAEELARLGDDPDLPEGLGRLPGLIRGMCRHAVDGALRQLALRWAVLAEADLQETVAALDEVKETTKRLKHAERYALDGTPSPAAAAREACQPYLRSWNQAAHDSGGTDVNGLAVEISAARTACAKLAEWGCP